MFLVHLRNIMYVSYLNYLIKTILRWDCAFMQRFVMLADNLVRLIPSASSGTNGNSRRGCNCAKLGEFYDFGVKKRCNEWKKLIPVPIDKEQRNISASECRPLWISGNFDSTAEIYTSFFHISSVFLSVDLSRIHFKPFSPSPIRES